MILTGAEIPVEQDFKKLLMIVPALTNKLLMILKMVLTLSACRLVIYPKHT